MGLFSFIKEAGKKIFGSKEEKKQQQPELTDEQIRQQQIEALKKYITDYGITIKNLGVSFKSDDTIVLNGEAETKEDYEKIGLITGNVLGIAAVDNQITYNSDNIGDSRTYTVQKGDTLWKIAEQHYSDGSKYNAIFEANQPMIKDADEIYPGQVLRIPELQTA